MLSLVCASFEPRTSDWGQPALQGEHPGPKDLGLAYASPLLAEVRCAVGYAMYAPHDQLATLAPLVDLKTVALDFVDDPWGRAEDLLRPDALLSLPPSVTKLVLCRFEKRVPAVALPENIAIVLCVYVHEESLLGFRTDSVKDLFPHAVHMDAQQTLSVGDKAAWQSIIVAAWW